MTKAEWAVSLDPMKMLAHLRVDPDSRKALRFLVACCRRAEDVLPEVCWEWVSRAERAAEDKSALAAFRDFKLFERVYNALLIASESPGGGRVEAVTSVVAGDWLHEWPISDCPTWAAERAAQAHLVRRMFSYK